MTLPPFTEEKEMENSSCVGKEAMTERTPYPGQQWKCGDEFLPFHPQASHVPPDYRDGWNRCYWMSVRRATEARMLTEKEAEDAYAGEPDWMPPWRERIAAVVRKFCEVNGIRLATATRSERS